MKSTSEVIEDIENYFDAQVRELGQEDYREVLENIIGDLQCKLDCVEEEMEAEGID